MKKFLPVTILLLTVLPMVCFAKKTKKNTIPPSADFVISSVSSSTVNLVHQDTGAQEVYSVTARTTVEVADSPASLTALKKGMVVRSYHLTDDTGSPQVLEDLDVELAKDAKKK